MAFSQSLDIGNSTLLNLDNQALHAIDGNVATTKQATEVPSSEELEVVQESPTQEQRSRRVDGRNGVSMFSRTRTQRQYQRRSNDVAEQQRRQFRRSKSDSTLPKPLAADAAGRPVENYTEFFHSGFTFSVAATKSNCKHTTDDGSMLRISQVEAAFQEIESQRAEAVHTSVNLDVPIFSEDMKALLGGNDSKKVESELALAFANDWRDTLQLSEHPITNVNSMNLATAVVDEALQLDTTSFVCPAMLDAAAHQQLQQEIESSRRVVTAEMHANEHNGSADSNCLPARSQRSTTRVAPLPPANGTTQTLKTAAVSPAKNELNLDQDLESLKRISAWNLPHSVLQEYEKKGVIKMFDWQIQCLSNPKVLFEHCNLVYSAPTSAGKSLVSEILLLKTVLERGKKALFILPFISVVREKMFYLQDLLTVAGYRVEGFFGGYTPPGGFESIHVAICTIEKANSIVNKLLEHGKLDEIGTIVVDEVHLISDPGRGYILELLLAKVLYMSRKYGLQIQVVTMSATLANVELLKRWLDAELYITDFRPVALQEMIKIGKKIYDCKMRPLRDVTLSSPGEQEPLPALPNDGEHVAQLCIETLLEGCSVIVFCPSKDWCENLAIQLANAINSLCSSDSNWGRRLREQLKQEAIDEVKKQLRDIPTGLDTVLEKTISHACAFHHAGLTGEERDIIEASFKTGALKIIVATSTLSSGVNLPARRVLIRSPLFGGKQMNSLTYRQMIGRAGRTGKDTLGESILVCTEQTARVGRDLVTADLKPITSCLEMDSSTHLKRALLEVISSSVVTTKADIENFVNCTLLSAEKQLSEQGKDKSDDDDTLYITDALAFLIEYEFVRLQQNEETKEEAYVATRLGLACLAASMPPTDGLILFAELQKSRRCFVLESELHAVYLVTPYSVCYQVQNLDWLFFLDLWEKLTPAMKKVGELVGIKESFLVRAMRGQSKLDYKLLQIHKRFYTALALQELVNEIPINSVAIKYRCSRGMLQSLQQMASTFAGIVTAFCNSLQWPTLSLIVAQFKERLYFGVHRDLIDLMRLPDLNHKRARALFDGGVTTLVELANADVLEIEKILYNALSFDSAKQHDNEDARATEQRNQARNFFITGKLGLTVAEGAKLVVQEARKFIQYEIGVGDIKWTQQQEEAKSSATGALHMSCEEGDEKKNRKRNSMENAVNEATGATPPKMNKIEIRVDKINNSLELCDKPSTSQKALEALKRMRARKAAQATVENKMNAEREVQIETRNSVQKESMPMQQQLDLETKSEKRDCKEKQNPSTPPQKQSSNKENACNNIQIPKEAKLNANAKPAEKAVQHAVAENNAKTRNSNAKPNETPKQTMKTTPKQTLKVTPKQLEQISAVAVKPRRSPHNHRSSISTADNAKQLSNLAHTTTHNPIEPKVVDQLFMSDDSFELNTGVNDALAVADNLNKVPADLMSVQQSEQILNKSKDEVPSSQQFVAAIDSPMRSKHSVHASRYLRSTQRPRPQRSMLPRDEPSIVALQSSVAHNVDSYVDTAPLTSVELSELSMDNSLIKNPLQLNASHILSCSKQDTEATHFNRIEIIDICGNENLFKTAFKELMTLERLGFCVGLQQQESKRKPLIGANLLINQVGHEGRENGKTDATLFQINDTTYVEGCAFGIAENIVYYMNLQREGSCNGLTAATKTKYLSNLLQRRELTLLCVDAKEQLKTLRRAMPQLEEVQVELEDPKVANWLLQPDKLMSVQQMTQQFAPECSALIGLCGSGRGYSSFGLDAASAILAKIRCAVEASVTMHVLQGQIENLQRIGTGQLYKFFKELEMPLQLSLYQMEIFGFSAAETALRKLFQQMLEAMKKLEGKIYEMHGARFNLGSSAAVAKVLGLQRRASGRVSTSRQILEKIDSPISQLIITYRKLSTTLTNNIQPLLKCVQHDRIHGQSITFTLTGRISMAEPNLQNVAKDFDVQLGATEQFTISCRSAFYPNESTRCLLSSDFCQLEMRILAHLSQDATLLKVMNTETDIFRAIAARWHKIQENAVSEQLRNGTKQICYGIVYGMGMRSLAEALKCTEQEASTLSEQFHLTYPGIRIYADKIVKFARNNGYIETITGRRRYLEHINSGEPHLKTQAERQAINSTIQGSAADIAKTAILRIEKNMEKYREKLGIRDNAVRLVLHIHDELVFEVPAEKAKKIAKVLSLTMENCVKLNVPLRVKLKMGKSWGELKEVKL